MCRRREHCVVGARPLVMDERGASLSESGMARRREWWMARDTSVGHGTRLSSLTRVLRVVESGALCAAKCGDWSAWRLVVLSSFESCGVAGSWAVLLERGVVWMACSFDWCIAKS